MSNICPCTLGNSISKALNGLRDAKKRNPDVPEQTSSATLLSRTVKHANTMYHESPWLYLLTFRLENGEELELNTTEENYGKLREGTVLRLTWQGETLVSFAQEGVIHETAL